MKYWPLILAGIFILIIGGAGDWSLAVSYLELAAGLSFAAVLLSVTARIIRKALRI